MPIGVAVFLAYAQVFLAKPSNVRLADMPRQRLTNASSRLLEWLG